MRPPSIVRTVAVAAVAISLLFAADVAAAPPTLRAGAGQADITPPLGYSLGGWQRADERARGVSTRLYSRALVLQRGDKKVALVSASLVMVTAGMEQDIAAAVQDLGLSRETILLTANHTHSGPAGYTNNPAFNAEAPSVQTIHDPTTFTRFFLEQVPADRALYSFLVRQIAASIRRAHADRAPAVAGWGHVEVLGLTRNRSLEAFLMNFGIDVPYGHGRVDQAPGGYRSTIDPDLDLLRVDKLVTRRVRCARRRGTCARRLHRPIGAWTTFANHGTVVPGRDGLYTEDHFAAANRVFEQRVRRAGRVPSRQTVASVFANGAEGDQSSAFTQQQVLNQGIGPAERVGRTEAERMVEAWNQAGERMSRRPVIDVRATVACFCGRQTATGPVAQEPTQGLPFLTGSEEGRGPLFDITRLPLEGVRNPLSTPDQGNKVPAPFEGAFPPAIPVSVIRLGDRAVGALPVEATMKVGQGVKQAILEATAPSGVRRAVFAGLADDWIGYATTPQEYSWQAYEAGRTGWGPNEGTFLQERIRELAEALAAGQPAPSPYPFDPSYGVHPTNATFPEGAASGQITQQPAPDAARGGTVELAWTGAPKGHDRPVDTAFVTIQRHVHDRWTTVDSDLGLDVIWRADERGHHSASWRVPAEAAAGTYRVVITARRYELSSSPLTVSGA